MKSTLVNDMIKTLDDLEGRISDGSMDIRRALESAYATGQESMTDPGQRLSDALMSDSEWYKTTLIYKFGKHYREKVLPKVKAYEKRVSKTATKKSK